MKTQLQLIIILLVFTFHQSNGQCPTGSVTFSNQSQINDFIINYPDCQEINGNVDIMGGNITSLYGLSNITSINGGLFIQFNGLLTNISGLSLLETISGDFLFLANPNVENFDALNSLTSINGYLEISNNNNLNDITGIFNLNTANVTDLKIYGNPQLQICNFPSICSYLSNPVATHPREVWGNSGNCTDLTSLTDVCSLPCPSGNWIFTKQVHLDNFQLNYSLCDDIILNNITIGKNTVGGDDYLSDINDLSALENLTQTTGELRIYNTSLTSLQGLNSLTNTGGSLRVIGLNPFLDNLEGLNALTNIGGAIQIRSTSLVNFNGLNSVTSLGTALRITENYNLTDITALQNIDPETIGGVGLQIFENIQLSFCHLPNFCEYLSNPAGTNLSLIHTNASGCESSVAILAECALGIDTPVSENEWLVYKKNGQLEILTQGFELKEIGVYDTLGRKVYQSHIEGTAHTIPKITSNGLLVIKITTPENKILTKKVIN